MPERICVELSEDRRPFAELVMIEITRMYDIYEEFRFRDLKVLCGFLTERDWFCIVTKVS